MRIYRKPKTAKWGYESVVMIDDVTITNRGWTDFREIEFDATKDKRRGRHTTMKISLSENEVEALYGCLIKGRKLENRKLKAKVSNSAKRLTTEQNRRDRILSSKTLTEKWLVNHLYKAAWASLLSGTEGEKAQRTYDSTINYLDGCFQNWEVRYPYRRSVTREWPRKPPW